MVLWCGSTLPLVQSFFFFVLYSLSYVNCITIHKSRTRENTKLNQEKKWNENIIVARRPCTCNIHAQCSCIESDLEHTNSKSYDPFKLVFWVIFVMCLYYYVGTRNLSFFLVWIFWKQYVTFHVKTYTSNFSFLNRPVYKKKLHMFECLQSTVR